MLSVVHIFGILRNKGIYANYWEAEDEDDLAERIKYCLKSIDIM